jgi:hypothetical protein
MITGDQALPQPDDTQDSVAAPWRPTLPEKVLRREVLLRSCRWIFVIMGAVVLWGIGHTVYIYVRMKVQLTFEAGMFQLVLFSSWGLARSAAGFWALSHPQRLSRPVLDIVLAAEVITLLYLVINFAVPPNGQLNLQPMMLLLSGLSLLPDRLIILMVAILANTGAGRILYSPEGIRYFASEDAEKRPDIPWIGVGFALFYLANWFACQQLMHIIFAP